MIFYLVGVVFWVVDIEGKDIEMIKVIVFEFWEVVKKVEWDLDLCKGLRLFDWLGFGYIVLMVFFLVWYREIYVKVRVVFRGVVLIDGGVWYFDSVVCCVIFLMFGNGEVLLVLEVLILFYGI